MDLEKRRNQDNLVSILDDWTKFDFTYERNRRVKQILEGKDEFSFEHVELQVFV